MNTEEKTLVEIGGYEGLINSYFRKIQEIVDVIKNDYDYNRVSHAFAHWFLENIKGFNRNNVSEMITDDFDDWAIDAVNVDTDNDIIELYQFKLPTKEKNINNEISVEEVLKFLLGYKICSSGTYPDRTNINLKNKIDEIKESEIFNYKLIYVSYSDGLGYHAKTALDNEFQQVKSTGNQIEWELYDKTRLVDIYYSQRRRKREIEITLDQVATGTGFLPTDEITCYSIYVGLDQIAKICDDYNDYIFDENVRLFHGIKNKYNSSIMSTAISDSDNFHLYNNGIVILSEKINYNDMQKKMKIKNPKVVNGCQTMNSLVEARKKVGELSGSVQIKAIQITDPIVRQNISIYLNSQTEIKDSYLISNLPIIIQLEEDLKEKDYILERQANQISQMKKKLSKKQIEQQFGVGYSKVINLELAIQVYATFYEDFGPVAKLNKAKLFNVRTNLEKIFKNLTADKLIIAFTIYNKIGEVITQYRKYRRNNSKKDFLAYLNIAKEKIIEYTFMNTADLFLLSLFSKIVEFEVCGYNEIGKKIEGKEFVENFQIWRERINENSDDYIKKSIEIIRKTMIEDSSGKPPATLTKSNAFHKQLKRALHERYSK